jgi:hypothetical protein
MGDNGLSISGGSGGITAHYDDILAVAGVLDTTSDSIDSASGTLWKASISPDVAQAAVLCPVEAGETEAQLATSATAVSAIAVELEGLARLARLAVGVYKEADAGLARVEQAGWFTAGYIGGALAPFVALGLLSSPALDALLYAKRDDLGGDLQETLYDDPWLEEALTRSAPGFVQGLLGDFLGPLGLAAAGDGHWPSADYQQSILGLLSLAGHFGLLEDSGDFSVAPDPDYTSRISLRSDEFLSALMRQADALGDAPDHVQVITVTHPDGRPPSYIVQIPGTQVWSPKRGDNPVDLSTNVNLMAGAGETEMQQAVRAAMRAAGIPPGADVMLAGHSQGGITAMAMACDPATLHEFHITSVVTAGSPVGHFRPPSDVSVLSLEEKQDVVPKLDGVDNPDLPNWTTVTRDLSRGDVPASGHDLASAHSLLNYANTGGLVDADADRTIEEWREQNGEFLDGDGTIDRYHIRKDS